MPSCVVSLFSRPGMGPCVPQQLVLPTFRDVCRVIGRHREIEPDYTKDPKGKTPLWCDGWSATEFRPGTERKKEHATRVHAMICDIDGKPVETVSEFLDALDGVEAIIYSTHSHTIKPGLSLRVVFPFDEPVDVKDFADVWRGVQAWSGDLLDKTTVDYSKFYFLPYARPGIAPLLSYQKGEAIEWRNLAQGGRAARTGRDPRTPTKIARGRKLTIDDLTSVVSKLKRADSDSAKKTSKSLRAVVDGISYAVDGERHETMLAMTLAVVRYFPDCDPQATAELFRPSIEAANKQAGDPHIERMVEKCAKQISDAQIKFAERKQEAQEEYEKKREALIVDAWRGLGIERSTPYTEDEIAEIMTRVGAHSREELKNRWIVQSGNAYYILLNGEYQKSRSKESAALAAKRDLAPAHTAGVETHIAADEGEGIVPLPLTLLCSQYGTEAPNVVVDLSAQRGRYDPLTKTMFEAPTPIRRDIEPAFDPRIDAWLRALGGDKADLLIRWVEYASDLSRACVALGLFGARNVGKSLFAKGMSRIWKNPGGATRGAAVLGKGIIFNERLVENPIVFIDERMPDGVTLEMLREFISNTDRDLNRKNRDRATMIGATRVVIAGNGMEMLASANDPDEHGMEAIAERILDIVVDEDASQEALRAFDHPSDVVNKDLLAAHSLWLAQRRATKHEGRFMIVNRDGPHSLAEDIRGRAGRAPLVKEWFVRYLQNPKKYHSSPRNFGVIVKEGILYAQADALAANWDLYLPNQKQVPPTIQIARGVTAISSKKSRRDKRDKVLVGGVLFNYYAISKEQLIGWAEETGISSREEIEIALSIPTLLPAVVAPRPVATVTPIRIPTPKTADGEGAR